jgi:hypothetical protein
MSYRGAAHRYYPPSALEILRLATSVALTPLMALTQLVLWPLGKGQHPTWVRARSVVQRLSQPRAHALLAAAVQTEVFADENSGGTHQVHELERCIFASPSFSRWIDEALAASYPHQSTDQRATSARSLVAVLQGETPESCGPVLEDDSHLAELVGRARAAVDTVEAGGDMDSVVAGEAARSDVINTVLTGVIAKAALGQLKLGVYGIALLLAPPLYFRWSNGREEKIRRTIDSLLPDGRWSLSKAGWNFDWTDSLESVALMIGLFLGLSAIFSIVGYLMAPVLAPAWRLTGLPALSLRRAVDASERKIVGRSGRQSLSPEIFAAKAGDLAELFTRSG